MDDDAGTPAADVSRTSFDVVSADGSQSADRPSRDVALRDLAAADRGPDFLGAARCGTADVLLCEGFEAWGASSRNWRTVFAGSPRPMLEVASGRAARGQYALHIKGLNQGDNSARITRPLPASLSGHMFARAFVYIDMDTPLANFEISTVREPRIGRRFVVGGERRGRPVSSMRIEWGDGVTSVHSQYTSRSPVPVNRWSCWEWEFDGSTKQLRVWVDESKVIDITQPTWTAPRFEEITFGYRNGHVEPGGYDVWIDEVAANDRRIGCAR